MTLEDLAAEATALDVDADLALLDLLRGFFLQFVERIDAGLGLGAAGFGHAPDPFQLAAQQLAGFFQFGAFGLVASGFFLQEVAVVARILVQATAIQFDDGIAHSFEKIAVVGDHEDGAIGAGQVLFEPFDHVEIEVVGRLVEDEQLGLLDEQACQGQPFALTARQGAEWLRQVGNVQSEEHFFHARFGIPCLQIVHAAEQPLHGVGIGTVQHALLVVAQGLDGRMIACEHGIEDVVGGSKVGFLRQVAHADVGMDPHAGALAFGALFAGDDAQQRALAAAVFGDERHLLSFVELQVHVLEQDFLAVGAGYAFQSQVIHRCGHW